MKSVIILSFLSTLPSCTWHKGPIRDRKLASEVTQTDNTQFFNNNCSKYDSGLVQGLTDKWSMEYVGADLAKELMQQNGVSKKIPIGVMDTPLPKGYRYFSDDHLRITKLIDSKYDSCDSSHGTCVSNLIVDSEIGYGKNLEISAGIDYNSIPEFLKELPDLKRNGTAPWVINNSWGAVPPILRRGQS